MFITRRKNAASRTVLLSEYIKTSASNDLEDHIKKER